VYICPACNGLTEISQKCTACGNQMRDAGVISDFYDSYSAYLDSAVYADGYRQHGAEHCLHLVSCNACGHTSSFYVTKIKA